MALGIYDIFPATRILAAGSEGAPAIPGGEEFGGPPFWAGMMFLTLAVATLFSAYGLWVGQKWGKVVTLVTRAILILFALGDLVGATMIGAYNFAAISAVYVVLSIVVVALVLRRQPKPVMA
jgi:uncharacterized membrane protein (DUF2068 family)